jgi:hypothetical protein
MLKELLKIFYNTEIAKDKMVEADLNLERNITICQGIEEMIASMISNMMSSNYS